MPSKSKTKQWKKDNLPDFKGARVFVLGGAMYGAVVTMLAEANCRRARDPKDADFVVFIGGSDINPKLYGQKAITETGSIDERRDLYEEAVYRQCLRLNKPMFGICRGAQFLHACCGGDIWQHVDNHAGKPHLIYDVEEDVTIKASSLHHQMMQFNKNMTLLAVCNEDVATVLKDEHLFINRAKGKEEKGAHTIEVEACYYEKEKCLCIEGHPEIGPSEFMSWSLFTLERLLHKWDKEKKPTRPTLTVVQGSTTKH